MRLDLPTGTVTFLFTDIEGSTALLQDLGPEPYGELLSQHHRVCRVAWATHGGVEVDTTGDAFFVAFPTASGAISAASDAQDALAALGLHVRMGIHTGEVAVADTGYVGFEVHRAARIAAAAHGGQVVVSQTAAVQAGCERLVDLGEHRFKDVFEPMSIFQLGEGRFPPLKTISNTNLPRPASSFVGRERELAEVFVRVDQGARLVTLTGPGGSGKTRLALEAAAALVPKFKAGVFWVGLAALREPPLVIETVSQALGANGDLAQHIGTREMLLLLDNLEQVIDAAPDLLALLRACANLRLLVTSRELLRIDGEVDYPVPPLAVPEAMALFCQRAQIEPSDEIAGLCVQLDNLPLAVELAAARTNALAPVQILARLSKRLDLLKGGRGAEPRQQTLRATIEWSYDLLSEDEQRLFRRLSVFAGGCTLEAGEQVADADLDTIQSLVDKSLLRLSDERYWMLETIREYSNERLDATPEADVIRERHAKWVLQFVRRVAGDLRRLAPAAVTVMRSEQDNVRAALAWSTESHRAEVACEVLSQLCVYWIMTGSATEARALTERVLAGVDDLAPGARLNATIGGSEILRFTGDLARSVALKEDTLEALADLPDDAVVAAVGGMTKEHVIVSELKDLAQLHGQLGDIDMARARAHEAVERARHLPEPDAAVAGALFSQALGEFFAGHYVAARETFETALAGLETSPPDRAGAVLMIGECFRREGRIDDAVAQVRRAVDQAVTCGELTVVQEALQELAALALIRNHLETAARLAGASQRLRSELGTTLWDPADFTLTISALGDHLAPGRLDELMEAGAALDAEEIVALACSID
jgi:predicted ATPase